MEIIPLHKNRSYTDFCCTLLNEEWPRSVGARIHSLEASCDHFPISFVLLYCHEGSDLKEPIGHLRISLIPRESYSCFIESVIIRPDMRGKGFGKQLMALCENYAARTGIRTAYLSTIDKQDFYSALGYAYCNPVSIWGGPAVKNNDISVKKEESSQNVVQDSLDEKESEKQSKEKSHCNPMSNLKDALRKFGFQEPPRRVPVITRIENKKMFMKKELSCL